LGLQAAGSEMAMLPWAGTHCALSSALEQAPKSTFELELIEHPRV
jgi:hypothetical protein